MQQVPIHIPEQMAAVTSIGPAYVRTTHVLGLQVRTAYRQPGEPITAPDNAIVVELQPSQKTGQRRVVLTGRTEGVTRSLFQGSGVER